VLNRVQHAILTSASQIAEKSITATNPIQKATSSQVSRYCPLLDALCQLDWNSSRLNMMFVEKPGHGDVLCDLAACL
jgi:hypothetical protein